ncbi:MULTISPECIES: DUF535 family protein [Providencia]|uniref:DUF535 family protein n=3 Tax=Providencia TaxID=586 RepID=A0AA42FKI5_9GAMM|nr:MULTISPECIES: DUF535 family protein [Providencia]HCI95183.1 DUF535 domain-containing protein [Providencia sp.]APC13209.1 hypothetical protein RB151_035570 [Providencia rettgeri]AVL72589.1 DUF535 domain-containing protein [Providencia rettgeri]EIL1981336.1 DUF535 family protein [Providencia rettgeri]EIU9514320.1 DUF535 family protein [Providencia rettgeri]
MGLLKQWRKENKVWRAFNSKYVELKRKIRITKLPTEQYKHYQVMCQNYRCAQFSAAIEGVPHFIERPINKYLHKAWTGKQKLLTASYTLNLVETTFKPEAIEAMFCDKREGLVVANIELKSGDFAQLTLIYSQYPREGDLTLHLKNETGDEIYLMSFSFGPEGQLYVCSLQGPSTEQSVDQVRLITKQMHGMRPKNLLMSAVYAVATFFHVKSILGVSNQCHIKSQHLKSSYDTFWLECNGTQTADGWFQLPIQEPVRDIESVKSQRRAEFRRREALRDAMTQEIIMSLTKNSQHNSH